ncbi:aminoacyl-tRNA deacylase [Leucobacter luti]|uniref:Prolyl-tRNA editing enzyme YbaK/EbsC (Cys-tRNA(Pro) deacylase) n=1 Tax=Leucobacter luti TaxID=340320 RepID=A0A4Q7U470_9MICO|nr:YbaK/EbsC family protein [Leucobacter luti]MBL3700685.1 ybaK/ebsC protein [Leucobacter luti]RZT68474.1 prolyl-tRNA editing enzyme YbaK/EbsC (Cys-tRNA(Pro) deacylase) [Leucobacter luti]
MSETVGPQNTYPSEVERAAADAAARGLAVDFVAREGSGPPADGMVGGAPIAKTVVVQLGGEFALVLAPLAAQFSWPKLRALLGVNRVSLPDAAAAFEATGYERGTISPVGARSAWPVYLDTALAAGRIALGSGSHAFAALVDAAEFAAAYDAVVADLSVDPSAAGSTPAAAK